MSKFINVASPSIGRKERRAVDRVLKSKNLAQGKEVESFEYEFANYIGQEHAVAVNSGTSGLHVALQALGIGKGDEVIVPSFTFAATANAVAIVGAKPVFVDIDINTYCIDPSSIAYAITKKTKAIMPVHLYGHPADMGSIAHLARKHDLLIIEDAAQAHGAEYHSKKVGMFGDAAVFSFYPTKNMTSGEGGMILVKDMETSRVARLLRNQGMERRYENEIVGYNLRMTDIHAAIGRVQLQRLETFNEKRRYNAKFLNNNIDDNVITPTEQKGCRHVYHQYTIRIPDLDRDKVIELLNKEGIGSGVYYPTAVHQLPSYNKKTRLYDTEQAIQSVISLPVHPDLSENDLHRIANAVNKVARLGA